MSSHPTTDDREKRKRTEPEWRDPIGRDPYAEGSDAALAGYGDDQNPYKPATPAQASWSDGWNAIKADEEDGDE